MHEQIEAFLGSAAETFMLRGPVYQLDSRPGGDPDDTAANVKAPLRTFFSQTTHIDRDLAEAGESNSWPFPDGVARTVICVGTLQEGFRPHRAVAEMARMLAPGGVLLLCTSAAGQPSDPTPASWQPTPHSVGRLLAEFEATLLGWQGMHTSPHTIYGIGFKAPLEERTFAELGQFADCFQARLAKTAGRNVWRRLRCLWPAGGRSRRDHLQVHFTVHLSVSRDRKHDGLPESLPKDKTGTRLDLTE